MTSGYLHEIRDPIHVFIRLDSDERQILDSRAFQRLRHIHQLAMSYLVYPGATHRRFEHSLGVMELADRVFHIITAEEHRDDRVREIFPGPDQLTYWRRVLRMAALCHDIGHLPFSHAAENLLPAETSHEDLTLRLIRSPEMSQIWEQVTPPLRVEDICKLAVGPKKLTDTQFTNWEAILSEIIVGDCFGVDRMDYLLRDSLHSGVAYGKFDHFRLIDTLRILPKTNESDEPQLGIEAGGVESAEALLLARYFMYSQVYFHHVRRAYNVHLQEFMTAWLGDGGLPVDVEGFLELSDNEVLAEIRKAARDSSHNGHDAAQRIINRKHYRVLYARNPTDLERNPDAAKAVCDALKRQFPEHTFYQDSYRQGGGGNLFPVRAKDGRIVQSLEASEVLKNVPVVAVDFVFGQPEVRGEALKWISEHLDEILESKEAEES
jgi:uncharacterized protein